MPAWVVALRSRARPRPERHLLPSRSKAYSASTRGPQRWVVSRDFCGVAVKLDSVRIDGALASGGLAARSLWRRHHGFFILPDVQTKVAHLQKKCNCGVISSAYHAIFFVKNQNQAYIN